MELCIYYNFILFNSYRILTIYHIYSLSPHPSLMWKAILSSFRMYCLYFWIPITFIYSSICSLIIILVSNFFFSLFWWPSGISSSQTRSELQLWPMLQLQQCWILNPLCWVRAWTCVPVLQRCHRFHCTTVGMPHFQCFNYHGLIKIFSIWWAISPFPVFP